MTKLTPLPTEVKRKKSKKDTDHLWLIFLLGGSGCIHSLIVLTLDHVQIEFLQGALIALGTVSLAWLFYKGYRKAVR